MASIAEQIATRADSILSPRVVDVSGRDGALVAPEWLDRAERVHRQLRHQCINCTTVAG